MNYHPTRFSLSPCYFYLRDPDIYPDYDEFRPSRFLDASGKMNKEFSDVASMGHVTFGFGKRWARIDFFNLATLSRGVSYTRVCRNCVGMNVASQSLFMDIACILWALDIEQATDSQGNRIVPSKVDCVDNGIVVWVACACASERYQLNPHSYELAGSQLRSLVRLQLDPVMRSQRWSMRWWTRPSNRTSDRPGVTSGLEIRIHLGIWYVKRLMEYTAHRSCVPLTNAFGI